MLFNEGQRYQACNAGSSQVVQAVAYVGNAEERGLFVRTKLIQWVTSRSLSCKH
jgi:hypothetical protein